MADDDNDDVTFVLVKHYDDFWLLQMGLKRVRKSEKITDHLTDEVSSALIF